ncbi:DMT family transporter [Desulfovibrio intestinalis]|uniref:DME family drug/metabolite transporter n=1 Tax=Desulfovibrio intestinalis TaxID=58621 RepID=A0A7W8FGE6_9BACT|nr:EamA family transporter [Desulfovibrio intestinalis]MBB5143841.1 DME family drug/metabolite transporter [Desulfovibrio intestinalis]
MKNNFSVFSNEQQNIMGFSLAAFAAILWSFIGPLSKEALNYGISPLETAFWRAFIGCVCFSAQAAFSGGLRVSLRHTSTFFLFGWLGVGLLFGALQVSIQLSGAATAMVLLYTAPAWVALSSRIFFREAISLQKTFAIGTALAGVALICFAGGSLSAVYSPLGIICGLLAGIAYASHFPFYACWGLRYSTGIIYTYMLLGGTIFLLPFVSYTPDKTWYIWAVLFALGFLTNYVAYVALAASLRRISQIQAAVVGNIEPLFATLWVWAFFGENFTPMGWAGCSLVMAAVLLMTIKRG